MTSESIQVITQLRDELKRDLEAVEHLLSRYGNSSNGDEPVPERQPRQKRAPKREVPRVGAIKISAALRDVVKQFKSQFEPSDARDALVKKYPQFDGKTGSVAILLNDMVARGELQSEGAGRSRRFTVLNIKETSGSPTEDKWREFRNTITVPRDT